MYEIEELCERDVAAHVARHHDLGGRRLARAAELPYRDAGERLAERTGARCAYGGLRWGEMAALRRGRVDVLRRRLEIKEAISEISGRL